MRPVVMVPGWGFDARVFAVLAQRLSSRFAVSALDLPARADVAAHRSWTLGTLADDLASRAPAQCFVVGWSLGAQAALEWAHARPRQVERLALIAATPCFVRREDWECAMAPRVFDDFEAALRRDARGTLERFVTLQAQGDACAKSVMKALRAVLPSAPRSRALEESLRVLRDTDLRARLAHIAQPALVIHGERDALAPLAAAEHLARGLRNAKLRTIAGAAHAPFVSAVGHVAELLSEFFDE